MLYCEKCKRLCEDGRCPICDSENLRDARPSDFCFLTECDERTGEMLKDALEQDGINCALLPFGSGVRAAFGLSLGNYAVFVPFEHYEVANEIFALFNDDFTDDLKGALLENISRWHLKKPTFEKKLRKKLKFDADKDFFDCIKEAINVSDEISDEGLITTCVEGGHYIAVKTGGKIIWFNSATYEIIV